MKKLNFMHAMVAASAVMLGVASIPAAHAQETLATMKPVKLRVATLYGPDNWFTIPMKNFTDKIEARTNGKVKFEYFYAGSLVPAKDLAKALGSGVYDFGFILGSYEPATYKVDQWQGQLATPYDSNIVRETVNAAVAGYQWTSQFEAHDKEMKSTGVFPIISSLTITGPFGILCKQDNSSLQSLTGKRMRVAGETWAKEAQNLGATPVSLPITEVYQAFTTGVIDCWMGATQDAGALGFFDHGKFYNFAGLAAYSQATYGFNMDTWKKLPADVKDIIWDETPGYVTGILQSVLNAQVTTAKATMQQGVKYVVPDPAMQKKIDDYHKEVFARAATNAPPSVPNPAAKIAALTETKAKWNKVLADELGFGGNYQTWVAFVQDGGGKIPDLEPLRLRVKTEIVDKIRTRN